MEQGKHEEAYHLLKSSLHILQDEVWQRGRVGGHGTGTGGTATGTLTFYDALKLAEDQRRLSVVSESTSRRASVNSDRRRPRLFSVPVYTGKGKDRLLQNQQNIFSFYTKAFEIMDMDTETDAADVSLSTAFVVLAYNMGLALFIGSTLNSSSSSNNNHSSCPDSLLPSRVLHNIRVFETAIRALTTSSNITTSSRNSRSSSSSSAATADHHSLLLALTFNLGYLHHINLNFQETRVHLKLAVDLVKCPATEDSLSDDDYTFFYANMCMFADRGMEQLHLAPAA